MPYALLYPHLAYHLGQRFRQHDPRKVTRALLAVDAVHCGLGMALLGFSVVPSLMFLLVLSFTALVIGGLRLLGMALLVSASSALLVAVLVAPPLLGNTSVEVAAVSILFCGLYICITAFFGPPAGPAPGPGAPGDRPRAGKGRAARAQPGQVPVAAGLGNDLQRQEERCAWKPSARSSPCSSPTSAASPSYPMELEAEALTDLLNNYLNEMSKIALKYGGTIDKFVGDCVMVFFGDPSTQGREEGRGGCGIDGHRHAQAHEGAAPAVAGPRASPSRWKSAMGHQHPAIARW
ncbi:protein CyaB [Pseudomonas aeruginosa]|nr:protein CyaB [Pseudomonas aeruginosa]